jgi:hypothetical protein
MSSGSSIALASVPGLFGLAKALFVLLETLYCSLEIL